MYRPAITKGEWRDYRMTLRETHSKRVSVGVLNLAGESVARVGHRVIDGQVNIDASGDVDRACTVTFYDPTHALNFDSDNPDDGAMYADRMLRVFVSLNGPRLDERVSVPVFTGPIVSFARDGSLVTVEAQGKELFGLSAAWRPMTIPKGTKKTDAIRMILEERMGETNLAIPDLKSRLPRPVVIGRKQQPWKVAQRIARSMNRQLFYDGSGTARLRVRPQRPLWTFSGGAEFARPTMTSELSVDADLHDVRNTIWVKGGKPKGAKRPVTARAVAPRSHPLSPWRLGRDNAPRFLLEEVNNDDIRSVQEAQRLADRVLRDRLRQMVEVTFDALPVYHLDPGDLCRVQTKAGALEFRLNQASIPLGIGGDMSVGYWKQVQQRGRRRWQ